MLISMTMTLTLNTFERLILLVQTYAVLCSGEQVHFHHLDESCSDHMNINDLLVEAGVQSVSFPKDQRVITV